MQPLFTVSLYSLLASIHCQMSETCKRALPLTLYLKRLALPLTPISALHPLGLIAALNSKLANSIHTYALHLKGFASVTVNWPVHNVGLAMTMNVAV